MNSEENSDIFKCHACQIRVNSVTNLEQHLNSKGHKKKMEKQEKMKKTKDEPPIAEVSLPNSEIFSKLKSSQSNDTSNKWHCTHCDKFCSGPESLLEHIKGKKHMSKIKAASGNFQECTICDKKFNSADQLHAHAQTEKHVKKMQAYEKTREIMDGTVSTLKQASQMEGTEEIQSLKKLIFPAELRKPLVLKTTKDDVDLLTENSSFKEFEATIAEEVKQDLKCVLCLKTFNGLIPLDSHLQSNGHKKNLRAKISQKKNATTTTPLKIVADSTASVSKPVQEKSSITEEVEKILEEIITSVIKDEVTGSVQCEVDNKKIEKNLVLEYIPVFGKASKQELGSRKRLLSENHAITFSKTGKLS